MYKWVTHGKFMRGAAGAWLWTASIEVTGFQMLATHAPRGATKKEHVTVGHGDRTVLWPCDASPNEIPVRCIMEGGWVPSAQRA
jgi:hypothetical protein